MKETLLRAGEHLEIEKEIKRYERNDVKSRRRVPTLDPRDQSKWTAVGLVAIA